MIALLAALLAGTATVAVPVPAPDTAITPAIPSVSQPLGHDDRGRPQIDVSVNEQGPFPMVVDTAAQSSLMSPDLAAALKLQPMDSDLSINGATGSTKAQIYPVDHFASALFDEKMVGVLMFPNPGTTSARGIVGMEHFGEGKLTFDRTNARLSFGPSAPAGTGFATHKGELHGGLLVVPLTLDGVAMKATVDTGAGVTIANAAALKALGWSVDDSRLVAAGTIRGATAAQSAIRMGRIGKMQLGPVGLSNVPVYFNFGDTSASEPMVILGSDILGLLDAYALDFPRAELQIRIPGRS
jgi:predicted aspartyl protease